MKYHHAALQYKIVCTIVCSVDAAVSVGRMLYLDTCRFAQADGHDLGEMKQD